MNELSFSYCAGLFDGEGCVRLNYFKKYNNAFGLSIAISMTNKDVIQKLYENFGGTFRLHTRWKENYKDLWDWTLSGRNAKIFLANILPYSIVKKEEILVALEYPLREKDKRYISDENKEKRVYIFNRLKELKKIRNLEADIAYTNRRNTK